MTPSSSKRRPTRRSRVVNLNSWLESRRLGTLANPFRARLSAGQQQLAHFSRCLEGTPFQRWRKRHLLLHATSEHNQVARTTGLDHSQLEVIADAFVAYFQGPPGQIQMQVTAFGQPRRLFNAKEIMKRSSIT